MSDVARVLFLSSYTGLGGGETALLSLLGALDRARVQATLLAPREGQLTAAVRDIGLDAHILPYRGASVWFVPRVWARLPAARTLRARIHDIAPDAVHTDFHTLPFAAPACRELGLPLIFTCWGWWFRPKPWQRGSYRHDVRATLAGSDAIKRGFLGTPPFMTPDRVRVVYPGVDPGIFHPRPSDTENIRRALGLPVDAPLITLVARFQNVKGHDVFLTAARLLADRVPTASFAIAGENVFGGSVDAVFKRRILAMVAGDPVLRARVHFLGWVGDPERLIAASDVVVCSSRFESFGMVAVEAMSCGVPVVSTNVGGPAETIVDGETGFLVPPERPDLIAERVATLLDDDERRRRMGRDGRARVIQRFALSRYAAVFHTVVDEVTERGPRVEPHADVAPGSPWTS